MKCLAQRGCFAAFHVLKRIPLSHDCTLEDYGKNSLWTMHVFLFLVHNFYFVCTIMFKPLTWLFTKYTCTSLLNTWLVGLHYYRNFIGGTISPSKNLNKTSSLIRLQQLNTVLVRSLTIFFILGVSMTTMDQCSHSQFCWQGLVLTNNDRTAFCTRAVFDSINNFK